MIQNLRRLQGRIETRLSRISQSGVDWAYWDSAAEFVANRKSDFVETHLTTESFHDSSISVLAIWEGNDRLAVAKIYRQKEQTLEDPPNSFLAEITRIPGFFQHQPEGEVSGYVRTSRGILLLSAQPISSSSGEGPVRGTLLVGSFLDSNEIDTLQAHEPFSITLLGPSPAAISAGRTTATDGAFAAAIESEITLLGRMPIADLAGGTAAVVELRAPRTLHLQQVNATRAVVLALAAGSLVLLVVVRVLVDVLFVRRLLRLQAEVRDLRDEGGIRRLEATDGTPEFQRLGRDIAAMARGLRSAQLQAEAASRAKGAFLATMSHEIRTPMNGVLGFTSLLKGTPLTSEQNEYVTTIEQSGEILLALINDILDLSKLESGRIDLERQPVVLRDLANEIGALFSHRLKAKGVKLVLDCAADLPPAVMSDALRLRQVLFNLVGNAAKFTERGEVRVQITRPPAATGNPDGECVLHFSVADTGIGISAEHRTRLFQPFTQADSSTTRNYGGTGLGLAISQRLVQAMNGTIEVESTPGQGSRFFFSIRVPALNASPADHGTLELPAASASPRYAGRILVVEDNAVNRRMIMAMLHRLGCTADEAENGHLALERVAAAPSPYTLILMDVVMPEMDGLDATRAIRVRERTGNLSPAWIVALTASAMAEDRERCHAAGMNAFLSKPIRLGELIAALESIPNRPA